MRPRVGAVARAAELAEQTAARTHDTRDALEAEVLKRELAAERIASPAPPP